MQASRRIMPAIVYPPSIVPLSLARPGRDQCALKPPFRDAVAQGDRPMQYDRSTRYLPGEWIPEADRFPGFRFDGIQNKDVALGIVQTHRNGSAIRRWRPARSGF